MQHLKGVQINVAQYTEIICAWLQDRVAQYEIDSGYHAFVAELIQGLRDGAPIEAARHGELDDLLPEKGE